MPFNSYSYLLLAAAAVATFWALPVSFRRPYVVVLSFLFYASWHVQYALLPAVVGAGAYAGVRLILARPGGDGGANSPPNRARTWARWGIGFVLALLAFFKYRQFFLENLSALLSLARGSPIQAAAAVALPLGISFYSFVAIGALIDTRQKRVTKLSFVDLYLLLAFWPSVISGPIVRVRELLPQLGFSKPFESRLLMAGMDRLVWGLCQKSVIASSLAAWVDEGFAAKASSINSSLDNWALAVAYSAQIYFDFAAYTNMAIGSALLLGVRLPENFRFPYHAASPADFWVRWHMSLSRWIRDYLFFPINSRFKGAPRPLYASLLGIMVLVGLWHGAGWGFVLWGLLHGGYLVLHRIWESAAERRPPGPVAARLVGVGIRIATLIAVIVAWVPFRATSIDQAWTMLGSMFFGFRSGLSYSINFYIVTAFVVLFCVVEPALIGRLAKLDKRVDESRAARAVNLLLARPLLYAFGLLLFMIFDDRDSPFIYFQF